MTETVESARAQEPVSVESARRDAMAGKLWEAYRQWLLAREREGGAA